MATMTGATSRIGFPASLAIALVWWVSSPRAHGYHQRDDACIAGDFGSRNTVGLLCSFRDEASLWCDELSRALDYAPFITFPFYVHTRYELRADVAQLAAGEPTACLGLAKVTQRRLGMSEPWKNASVSYLEPYKLFLLVGATEMLFEASYNVSVPVGYVRVDADCWTRNRTSRSCAKEVRVAEQMTRPVFDTNPYLPGYWAEVEEVRTGLLGERDARLVLRFQHDYNQSAPVYVAPFVGGALQLRELRVSGVDLSGLAAYLGRLPHLRLLELSDDKIEVLAPEIFPNILNVENLNLAYNKLHNISEGILYLRNLTSLDLSGNPLDMSKKGMHNLTNILKRLGGLKWLFLAGMNFRSLSPLRPLLVGTRIKLLGLDLSYCGLTSISDQDAVEIFRTQTDLEMLSLSGNKFTTLPPIIFFELHNLKWLNFSSCWLMDSPQLKFSVHTVLRNLDLSHNNISLSKGIISSGCVENLDMSNNSIKYWSDPEIFLREVGGSNCWLNSSTITSQQMSAKNLNLSCNHLSTLTPKMMQSLQQLATVDLGGNPIDCNDCHTPQLQEWIRQVQASESPRVLNLGDDKPLTCSVPVAKLGAPVTAAVFDEAGCEAREDSVDYVLVLGVPLTTLAVLVVCVTIVMYLYRFELTYLMHLVKMKRRRSSVMHYMSQNYQYDAFVCYSGSDRAWVIGKLLPRLEQHPTNYRLCLHERDFVLGSFITSNIVTSMQNSRFTIVVLSNSFVQSQWCRWELEMANHKLFEDDSDFLILLELERLDRGAVPRHLKYLMDTRTYLEWPKETGDKDQEEVWKRLETAMGYSISNRQLMVAGRPSITGNQYALAKTVRL